MSIKVKNIVSYACITAACLAIAVALILLSGSNLGVAFAGFLRGIFGSAYAISEVLVRATPLMLAGLGVAVGFNTGFVNIGAEGQIYMGAIAMTFVAVFLPGLPPVVMILLCIIASFVLGGIWSLIPGILKAKFGVSEVINTIMFNYIAIAIVGILVRTVLKDPNSTLPMSPMLPDAASLPLILADTRLHAGIIIAVLCALALYIVLMKTPLGFRMRAVGLNARACLCAGIPVGGSIIISSLIGGGLAGIAGMCEIAGLHHKLLEGISPSYGYLAIIVALLGKNHPIKVIFSALGIAALQAGSLSMQRSAGVPTAIASIIMGTIVILILSRETLFKKLLGSEKLL